MSRNALTTAFAALSLIATAAVPAAAAAKNQEEQSSSSEQSGSTKAGKAERKICKTFANTASRMRGTRLCLTREQWREFEESQAI